MMHVGCLAVALWAAAGSGSEGAGAVAEPLLVVVEGSRAGGPGAHAIRRAIAEELKRPVVGPRDAAAARDMLLVTVDADSVSIQLRRSDRGTPRRHIEAVPAGATGVQVVAWLAGNLVRDQTADLLPALHSRAQPPAVPAAPAPDAREAAPDVPMAPRPVTEPPPQEAPQPRPNVPAVARASFSPPAPSAPRDVPWRFGVQAGLGAWLHDSPVLGDGGPFFPTARIELLGRPLLGRWGPWGTFNLEGGRTAVGVSAGIVRRAELLSDWWAAEFGVGAGFLAGEVAHSVFTPGGVTVEQRLSIGALVHGIATLAFTHNSMGEVVMSVGVNDSLARLWWPDLLVTWGVRIGL